MQFRTGSKISKVYGHLHRGLSLTPLQAIGLYTVYRLAADIERIRTHEVVLTKMCESPTGNTYAEYMLPKVGMKIRDKRSGREGEVVSITPGGYVVVAFGHMQRDPVYVSASNQTWLEAA